MNGLELEDLLKEMIQICTSTGVFIKEHLGKVQNSDIIEKEKHSLVSFVDIEAEKKIVDQLKKLIPEATYLTEEGTQKNQSASNYIWIIDPLDGTTNFLKGIPIFSISLALQYNNEIIAGVVYDIMRDECFSAYKNGGAYLNGSKIKVSSLETLEDSVIATGFPYARKGMEDIGELFIQLLKEVRGIRRLGSAAIDLAYTACGRFDAYYESRLNPWDIAAGILLIKEAGGLVTDFNNMENAVYSHHIVGGNPILHKRLLEVIQTFSLV